MRLWRHLWKIISGPQMPSISQEDDVIDYQGRKEQAKQEKEIAKLALLAAKQKMARLKETNQLLKKKGRGSRGDENKNVEPI
ncbi:hypothetical protein FRC20_008855 [Serendipita sp. 405]|nr:hypothetical protein FRC15_001250 [Serendipita sp. 397]KAG8866305.1 hypothetical protein FRC20_008855 [Serendipita sp. 405]